MHFALVLTLCAALALVAAAPASAVDRKQATTRALAALGSTQSAGGVVVFGLRKPVRAGARVTQEGSRKLVARVRGQRAFFFYEDAAPGRPFPHAGRVVLVGVKSGKAKLSATISRRPLVDGRLPAFLTNSSAYRSPRYRVYDAPTRKATPVAPDTTTSATSAGGPPPHATAFNETDPLDPGLLGPNSPPKADPQELTAKQGAPKRIVLTGTDDNGDLLTFFITKAPKYGTLTGQPPEVFYTANAGYVGPDGFTFKASDGEAESNAANVKLNVVALGAPPAVTTSAGCTAYTEQAPAVVVDGQLTVSDPDDAELDSARVRIADGHQAGDTLLFKDQNGISGSFDDNAGVLTLSGTATVAEYQAALSSVRFRNQSSGNSAATKDVEFVVNDAGNDSAPAVKQVCVTGGAGGDNDPPNGTNGEGGLSYTENDGPVSADGSFVVGDPDSANLSGATVKFVPLVSQPVDEEGEPLGPPIVTDTFAPAEDELAFADQLGITGSYDDTTGILTLSGTASLADYETAMRAVTYENTSEDPSDATRRLQFQLTDSSGANSTPVRRDVFVTPVNDAPVATASEGSTDYTGANTDVDPELSVIDVDDDDLEGAQVRIASDFVAGDELFYVDQLGISGVYDTSSGVLTLTGTAPVADYQTALRSVAYVHTGGVPTGSRSVEVVVNDGELDSGPTSKHVEINDEPVLVASEGALAYTENEGPVAADGGIAASDPESAELSGATVAITSGFAADEDELAFSDQLGITGAYDDTTGTLTLSGAAPVADYETALRSVTYENVSDNPTTARTLTFQVDDGAPYNNLSDPVTRDIAITPVNDAPVVTTSEGSTAYTEGDSPTPVDAALTVADADDTDLDGAVVRITDGIQAGDELRFVDQPLITAGVYDTETGTLTLSGTAPVADYEAALRTVEFVGTSDDPSTSKTVEFTVNDGELDSVAAAKEIAVTGVNDKPVLDTSDTALAYTAVTGPAAVDDALTASDADSAQLTGATVSITTGFVGEEDELAFTDQLGIAGSYDDTTGVLTLTGSAPVADYETALRSVTYENSEVAPASASRTVTFQVDDGAATDNLSDPATRDIDITTVAVGAPVVTTSAGPTGYEIGSPPVAIDAALTVTDSDDTDLEGAVVRIATGLEEGDEIIFADQAGITGVYVAATGILTLTGTASVAAYETALRSVQYRYTGENPSGTRSVEFTVNDGGLNSNPASKTIDITSPPI